jgi:hypothetical protein
MADKPQRASEYRSEQVALVRSTCLYVATKLGDLIDDVVVVGGLVPSLLIDQRDLPEGVSTHVGTMDLDVGLKLALLDHGRYGPRPVCHSQGLAGLCKLPGQLGAPPLEEEALRRADDYRTFTLDAGST